MTEPMRPRTRGVKITVEITAPTEEIRQQARLEVRNALTAAGYGWRDGEGPEPLKPQLRVIPGERQGPKG